MKKRIPAIIFSILVLLALLAGCALRNAATQPFKQALHAPAGISAATAQVQAFAAPSLGGGSSGRAPATAAIVPADESAPSGSAPAGSGGAGGSLPLIIKQGQIHLLVKDTDQSIDRLTQVVADTGGYIVSNRVWLESYRDANYKYATYTIAVPVDQFENALLRLRSLALRVVDETAGGQDVSQQYVDLQSRLTNLEATADRIRSFLGQAQTVDESLRINQELSTIEDQIEQVKGRMNYLSNRAAYSTITVQLDPELPPAPTPSPTPTPTPTPAPAGWDPGKTFEHAGGLAVKAAQFLVDVLIYLAVWIPFALPVLLIWGVYRLISSRRKSTSS